MINCIQIKYSIFLLVFIFFTSCSQEKQVIKYPILANTTGETLYQVNATGAADSVLTYDELIADVDLIRLETSPDCLIGTVTRLFFMDEWVIVSDEQYAKAVFIFDMNGNFITKIDARGKGPGEYIDVWGVEIDESNKEIIILDLDGRKMVHYDLQGRYVRSVPMPFNFRNFKVNGNDIYYYNKTDYNKIMQERQHQLQYEGFTLIVADREGTIKKAAFEYKYDSEKFHWISNKQLFNYNSSFYYNPVFSDTIYALGQDNIIPKYHLSLGEDGMSNLPADITSEDFNKKRQKKRYFDGRFFELEKNAFFYVFERGNLLTYFYSRETGLTCLVQNATDYPLHAFLYGDPIATYQSSALVTVATAGEIMSNLDFLKKSENREKAARLIDGFSFQSNPVVFIYHIKQS